MPEVPDGASNHLDQMAAGFVALTGECGGDKGRGETTNYERLTLEVVHIEALVRKKHQATPRLVEGMDGYYAYHSRFDGREWMLNQALGCEGIDDRSKGWYLRLLGNTKYDRGAYSAALELVEKELAIQLKTRGDEHPDVARSYMGMATVYHPRQPRQSARAV